MNEEAGRGARATNCSLHNDQITFRLRRVLLLLSAGLVWDGGGSEDGDEDGDGDGDEGEDEEEVVKGR